MKCSSACFSLMCTLVYISAEAQWKSQRQERRLTNRQYLELVRLQLHKQLGCLVVLANEKNAPAF